MTLTESQRNAIRSDHETLIEQDPRDGDLCYSKRGLVYVDGEVFDLPAVRALMRLGLCVVESGVTASDLVVAWRMTNQDAGIALEVDRMLDALTDELEKNR